MNEQKMVTWNILVEILNKFQAHNAGVFPERVNKYVNHEIYQWFYNNNEDEQ